MKTIYLALCATLFYAGFANAHPTPTTNGAAAVITSFDPISAAPGDTVIITGSNFIGVQTVLFGGENAISFTVKNSTTIIAIPGTGSVSGKIVVETVAYGDPEKDGFIMGALWKGGYSKLWNNPANWDPFMVPQANAAIKFSATAARDLQMDMNRTTGYINFNGSKRILILGNYNLTATAVKNASTDAYIQTNGCGKLIINVATGKSVLFPVGNSSYNPVTVANSTGTNDCFSARVLDEMFTNGTTGGIVSLSRVTRSWDITKSNPNTGSGVSMTFFWDATNDVIGSPVYMSLFRFDSTAGWAQQTGTTSTSTNKLTYSNYKGDMTLFGIANSAGSLPLTWLSFSGVMNQQTATLNWNTVNEQNTKDFLVQHSINGVQWNTIGELDATGNSTKSDYSFVHRSPGSGTNYYRLIQRDEDGRSSYSKTIQLVLPKTNYTFKVFPNPVVNGQVFIQTTEPTDLIIYNSIGVPVMKTRVQSGTQPVFLSSVPKGLYVVQAGLNNATIVVQ